MKTHGLSSLGAREGQTASFTSGEVVLDPTPACTIQAFVSFATGLSASGTAQASVDGVRWTDLTGTTQSLSANGSYLWVLSELSGVKRVRLAVTITVGIADFEIIAGVG